jgi:predicted amidophosphoribosyltransferase
MSNDESRGADGKSPFANRHSGTSACRCPYCDTSVADDSFVCAPCQVKLVPCPKCGKPRAESARRCPQCGDIVTPTAK